MTRAAILLALALLATPAAAQDAAVSPSERAAIRGVITRQIDAFRHDDAPAAFAFASPGLQAMFGSADNFMAMVRRSYQPVYHPRDLAFTDLSRQDGVVTQQVELTGPDGDDALAIYTLEPDGQGGWRITGCYLTRSARVGT